MSESTERPNGISLLRQRRVFYQTDVSSYGEGVVTEHDQSTGAVTVMDIDDGSFWRGSECLIEVIA